MTGGASLLLGSEVLSPPDSHDVPEEGSESNASRQSKEADRPQKPWIPMAAKVFAMMNGVLNDILKSYTVFNHNMVKVKVELVVKLIRAF
jgi:hypothetical protein